MNIRFKRPNPYNYNEGLVVSEVIAFFSGFETIIGYIIKTDNGFKRVWVL